MHVTAIEAIACPLLYFFFQNLFLNRAISIELKERNFDQVVRMINIPFLWLFSSFKTMINF